MNSGWAVIVIALWILANTAAISLYSVDDVARRAEALYAARRVVSVSLLLSGLGWIDGILMIGAIATALLLAFLEWRHSAVTRLLQSISPVQIAILLGALLTWLGQYCFVPGVLLGGDTATHITRFFEVRQALAAGKLPLWTNDQYLGSPLLTFTGPLTYLVGGVLDLLIRNPVATAKIFLFSTKFLTGVAFYRFLRRLGLGGVAALAGAIGFAGSFSYVHLFLYRGVFPQALTMLFLVLLFDAAEGLMTSARTKAGDWCLFAVATAGLIVNHQPHALFASLYLLVFGATSLVVGRWRVSGLVGLTSAGIAGVVSSAIAVIPILAQSQWVMIQPGSAFFRFRLPTLVRLMHLVVWRDTRTTWGSDYWAYLGTALLILFGIGVFAAYSNRLDPDRRKLVTASVACLPVTMVVWNPVVRDVMFILLFVAIIAACGMQWLVEAKPWQGRAATLMLICLILDTGSTAVQPVARLDKRFLIQAGNYIAQHYRGQRIVQISIGRNGGLHGVVGPNASPISYYSDVQRVAGTHNMAATRVHNYGISTIKMAQSDLDATAHVTRTTRWLLAMLNVRAIICPQPFAMGCPPAMSSVTDGPLQRIIPIPHASPVFFSRDLVKLTPSKGLDKPMLWNEAFRPSVNDPVVAAVRGFLRRWLAVTDPSPDGMAASIGVRTLPHHYVSPSDGTAWHAALVSYHVGLQTVRLVLDTSGPGYVQLAFPWYPGTRVSLNGHRVSPIQGSVNLMVVPLPGGIARIVLSPDVTSAEMIAAAVSLIGLLLIAAGTLLLRFRPSRAR